MVAGLQNLCALYTNVHRTTLRYIILKFDVTGTLNITFIIISMMDKSYTTLRVIPPSVHFSANDLPPLIVIYFTSLNVSLS